MKLKKVRKIHTLQKINIKPLSDSESKSLKGGDVIVVIEDHIG